VLGGTGLTHNWEISREIVKAVDIPVFLAGGLHPGNVREAIKAVKPFGVDVCSGVRSDGELDPLKLRLFIEAVNTS
jgi:phosphoribosylanthranilate isomerase